MVTYRKTLQPDEMLVLSGVYRIRPSGSRWWEFWRSRWNMEEFRAEIVCAETAPD